MAKIKIGQIGVAHGHAAGKMRVLRASDDFEVVGIVEPDRQLREAAQKSATYAGLNWMSREQLFAVPNLQAVAVETDVSRLLENARACVEVGLHIHLDKPAGESLAQFRQILDVAAAKHLVVQMGYMYRYNPAVVLLRRFLEAGWLGEPFELHAVMSKVVSPAARAPLARFEGGIMFELGCHLIDLVVALLGTPDRVSNFSRHAGPADDGLADNMLAVFEYPTALATVKSAAVEVEGFARRHLVLCGSEGTFHMQPLDASNVRVAFSKARGAYRQGYQTIELGDYPRYVEDFADMARIIRGEKDSDYSYDHDYAVQKTVLGACGVDVGV